MDGVVVLEPVRELLEDSVGIWAGVHPDIVALESLHEGLAEAVGLPREKWRALR